MIFDTLRKQTFAATLSSTRKGGAAALRFHARAKTMLAFTRTFRWLIGAFHLPGIKPQKVRAASVLSMCVCAKRPSAFDTNAAATQLIKKRQLRLPAFSVIKR